MAAEAWMARLAMTGQTAGGSHYQRLERAIIALEYALADARSEADDALEANVIGVSRAQEALQQAGEELQEVLAALKSQALHAAAANARAWSESAYAATETARP